jgi:hypothetical protein
MMAQNFNAASTAPALSPETIKALNGARLVGVLSPGSTELRSDSPLALICQTVGDELNLPLSPAEGYDSFGPDSSGLAWIVTSHGNRYGVGKGAVIDVGKGIIYTPSANQLDVVVGRGLKDDDVGQSSLVTSVTTLQGDQSSPGNAIEGRDLSKAEPISYLPFETLSDVLLRRDPAAIAQLQSEVAATSDSFRNYLQLQQQP